MVARVEINIFCFLKFCNKGSVASNNKFAEAFYKVSSVNKSQDLIYTSKYFVEICGKVHIFCNEFFEADNRA